MELKVGLVCDRGLNPKRPVNQDRFLAIAERGLFAVFDGVGGQRAGEVASQTAAETIEEALAHTSADSSAELIRRAIRFANRDIYEMAESDPAYKTMATTVALIHIDSNRATIAHVGDSRVYRLEEGHFYRETIDHTDFNDDLRAGLVRKEQEAEQPARNVINRALGVEPDVDVEVKTIRVRDGARFLLCSDGIYRHLADEEIARILAENKEPQRAADELKRIVHERGADDNLTAVVVQLGKARQSQVVAIESGKSESRDGPPVGARTIESSESSMASGRAPSRGGRIQVDFGKDRAPRSAVVDERTRILDRESARQQARVDLPGRQAGKSASQKIIWALVAMVAIAGAFYAGLRASEMKIQPQPDGTARGNPGDSLKLGRGSFDSGNYQAAATHFASLLERDPTNAEAHYWLGRSQMELRDYAKAAASFEQAVQLHPTMLDGYIHAAAAYEALGERNKAAQMLARYGEERRRLDAAANSNSPAR